MTEEGRLLLVDKTSEETLYWILSKMVIGIAGGRWKPYVRGVNNKDQHSFVKTVTASDLAFAVYLLKHYTRDKVGERKKRFTDIKFEKNFIEYGTWVKDYSFIKDHSTVTNKNEIDEWVGALMERGDDGKKGSHGKSDDSDEEDEDNAVVRKNIENMLFIPPGSSLEIKGAAAEI